VFSSIKASMQHTRLASIDSILNVPLTPQQMQQRQQQPCSIPAEQLDIIAASSLPALMKSVRPSMTFMRRGVFTQAQLTQLTKLTQLTLLAQTGSWDHPEQQEDMRQWTNLALQSMQTFGDDYEKLTAWVERALLEL